MAASGHEISYVIPYAVNFSLVFGAAVYFARAPLKRFLYQRHERQKDLIESASRAKKEAERRYLEIQDKLKRLNEDLKRLEDEIVRDGENEARQIASKAEAEVKRIEEDATRVIANEVEQLLLKRRLEVIDLAVARAEKKVLVAMAKEDHVAILKTAKKRIEAETTNG